MFFFNIECILGHYGYNGEESCDECLLDSCDREHGVCTDTTACKPGRQPGELMKCDKGIKQYSISVSYRTILRNDSLTFNVTSSVLYQSMYSSMTILIYINIHTYHRHRQYA